MNMKIREARETDAAELTELMRAAKRSWGYPDEWMKLWSAVLRIDADAIAAMQVRVGEDEDGIVGFYALAGTGSTVQLEHLWVRPGQMGKGVGRALLAHALAAAAVGGAAEVLIESEPHAEAFYIRMGAVRFASVAAPAPGAPDRMLPVLRIDLGRIGPAASPSQAS